MDGAGARFADVALLGPVRGIGTPTLASGKGARAFAELLGPLGMPVEVVSERAGDAAQMKLRRSAFMKGLRRPRSRAWTLPGGGDEGWLEQEIARIIGKPFLERRRKGANAMRFGASTRWRQRASSWSSSASSPGSPERAPRRSQGSRRRQLIRVDDDGDTAG